MNSEMLDRIVNAVLYEGYMLYPYRPSALKNAQRFNFGVIYPRAYAEAQGSGDAWAMQTECLLQGKANAECAVRVRFLRMVSRSILKPRASFGERRCEQGDFEFVDRLEVAARTYQPWQEAAEETIAVAPFDVCASSAQPTRWPFSFSPWRKTETVRDRFKAICGLIQWDTKVISGAIELSAERFENDLFKLKVRITNDSKIDSNVMRREAALEQSLVSAHTIMEVRGGEFLSLADPPDAYRTLALSCQNVGTWPVLVGTPGDRDKLLSSPIILSDYPEVAPESPGDLFDGAEMDEILSLRILAMTDEEKREMAQSDARARRILERTEHLSAEHWMKLHGAWRGLRTAKGNTP